MRRLLVALAVAGAALLGSAAPAWAHAELVSTTPVSGVALDGPPRRVELTFTEPIRIRADAIRVFDGEGERVETTPARHPATRPATVAVELSSNLADGTYVVAWRVVSEDSHPIHGAFTFGVGASAITAGSASDLAREFAAADEGSRAVDVVYGVARFASFTGLALTIGGLAFLAFVWPGGWTDSRTRRLLFAGITLAAVATAASLGLQGAYAAGTGLASTIDWDVISSGLGSRFGIAALARLALLGVAGVMVAALPPTSTMTRGVIVIVGGGLAATTGLAGHAATGERALLSLAADAVHVAAIGVWIGGLVVLASRVLRTDTDDTRAAAGVASRFSNVAAAAVAAIVLSGAFQSWRQVGTPDAATTTTYGKLLLTKLGVFVVLVAVAFASRSWVRRRRSAGAEDPDPSLGRLRQTVGLEVALAAVVLAVTAVLVNTVPARSALAQPVSEQIHTDDLLIDVTVDPAKRGPADVHVYTLTHAGQTVDVEELTAQLSLDEPAIGPIDVPLRKAGTGHYSAYDFELPLPGEWTLAVTARTSDIDQSTGDVTITVR